MYSKKISFFSLVFPATKPEEKTVSKTAKKDHGFKVAPDGRLIITEPKDDKGKSICAWILLT